MIPAEFQCIYRSRMREVCIGIFEMEWYVLRLCVSGYFSDSCMNILCTTMMGHFCKSGNDLSSQSSLSVVSSYSELSCAVYFYCESN